MARLIVQEQGAERTFPLGEVPIIVGRGSETDIQLETSHASRRHCRVEKQGDRFIVRDLGSTNGTFIGRTRVDAHELRDGDEIVIGAARLRFESEEPRAVSPRVRLEGEEERARPEEAKAPPGSPLAPAQYRLTVVEELGEERAVELTGPVVRVGRHNENEIVLTRESVSNHHCELRRRDDGSYELVDLESKNGTWVHGEPVGRYVLKHGDDITVVGIVLKFRKIGEPEPAPAPAEGPIYIEETASSVLYGAPARTGLKIGSYAVVAVVVLAGVALLMREDVIPLPGCQQDIPPDTGNLVRNNPSFEPEATVGPGTVPGWSWWGQDKDKLELDSSVATEGRSCALIELSDSRDIAQPAVLLNAAAIPAAADDAYELKADVKVDSARPQSFAALKVIFLSATYPEMRSELLSEFVTPTENWTPCAVSFAAPPWATELHIACAAFGQSAAARFDNLSLRRRAATQEDRARIALENLDGSIDPRGQLSVLRGSWPALWSGEVVLLDREGRPMAASALSRKSEITRLADGSLVVRSEALALAADKVYPLTFTLQPTADGLQVALPAAAGLGEEVGSVGFAFSVSARHLTAGIVLALGSSLAERTRPFGATANVRAVGWGTEPNGFFALFPQWASLSCTVEEQGGLRVLAQPIRQQDRSAEQRIVLKPFEPRLLREAKAKLDQASKDEQEGRPGAAILACQAVAEQLFYLKQPATEARSKLARLLQAAQEQFQAAQQAFERAKITLIDADFAAASDSAKKIAESLAGSAFEQKAKALLQDLTDLRASTRQELLKAEASALLAKGEAHFERGEKTLARAFFKHLKNQYPNTEWSRTAEGKLRELQEPPGP